MSQQDSPPQVENRKAQEMGNNKSSVLATVTQLDGTNIFMDENLESNILSNDKGAPVNARNNEADDANMVMNQSINTKINAEANAETNTQKFTEMGVNSITEANTETNTDRNTQATMDTNSNTTLDPNVQYEDADGNDDERKDHLPRISVQGSYFSFPSVPTQTPYSILHNILYLFKFRVQNPTQKVEFPVRDALEKDFMRCMVRTLLTKLEGCKEEWNATFREQNEDADAIDICTLNIYIPDLKKVPALSNEHEICNLAYQELLKYYASENKLNSRQNYDKDTSKTLNNDTNVDSKNASEVVLILKETPLGQNAQISDIEYKLKRTEVLQKLQSLYHYVMEDYLSYTSKEFVPYIGELITNKSRNTQDQIVHRLVNFRITKIKSRNEFWNIDIADEDKTTPLGKELEFMLIRNDGSISSLKLLNAAKRVYSNQLPNMPTHYIARLVFDRTHRSMLAVKDGMVVGGITYKPFEPQGFAEIAFVAVDASLQVKQCGTRLMNHLKDHFKKEGKIWRFLTFADNSAVGFFKKMGFSKDPTIQSWRYSSYIKYYTDVSLMECVLRPGIPYLKVREWITKQEMTLKEHIKIQEERRKKDPDIYTIPVKMSKTYNGLYFNSKGNLYNKYKGSRIKKIEDIPGLKNARGLFHLPSDNDVALLNDKLKEAWTVVRNHKDSYLLNLRREDNQEIYDPHLPPDLNLINERIERLYYRHFEMFTADIRRLLAYCKETNSLGKCEIVLKEKLKELGFEAEW